MKIERWLRRQLMTAHTDGMVSRLAVSHLLAGGRVGGAVTELSLSERGNLDDEQSIAELADEIQALIQDDATGIGSAGLQRYVIVAFVGSKQVARMTAHASALGDGVSDDYASEGPTATGLVTQAQRHLETRERLGNHAMASVMQYLTQTIDRVSQTNERLLDERLKTLGMIESLMSEKHTRELATQESQTKQQAMAELGAGIRLLLPAVAAHFAGEPAPNDPRGVAMRNLAESLQPEQMETIARTLTAEQLAVFATLTGTMQ